MGEHCGHAQVLAERLILILILNSPFVVAGLGVGSCCLSQAVTDQVAEADSGAQLSNSVPLTRGGCPRAESQPLGRTVSCVFVLFSVCGSLFNVLASEV